MAVQYKPKFSNTLPQLVEFKNNKFFFLPHLFLIIKLDERSSSYFLISKKDRQGISPYKVLKVSAYPQHTAPHPFLLTSGMPLNFSLTVFALTFPNL